MCRSFLFYLRIEVPDFSFAERNFLFGSLGRRDFGVRLSDVLREQENGMDVKTLSATMGHVSAATTLDIYSHKTDTMQMQAAVSIDRKIGGTNAQMPAVDKHQRRRRNCP